MKNVVFASLETSRAEVLKPYLEGVELRCYTRAETLILESHAFPPDVVVVFEDLPSDLPLPEVIGLLSRRPDLTNTHWVVLGGAKLLLECAKAGVDSILPVSVPSVLLLTVIQAKLSSLEKSAGLRGRIETLEERVRELQREEQSKEQLTNMLVHDLKNPVGAVMGLLDLVMEEEKLLTREVVELLKTAHEEASHVLYMAANILDVRKMQGGKMVLRRSILNRRELIDLLQGSKRDSGTEMDRRRFVADVPANLPRISADLTILRRILTNLISNAVKHTKQDGSITIRLRPTATALEFDVQDNGEGIPAEDLPKLFRPFEQARTTVRGRFDSGMGLAFCKLAVEQHGGAITVSSTRGVGTRFTFNIPLMVEEEDDDLELA